MPQYFQKGTTDPSSTPTREGMIYVNTTDDTVFKATGVASSADWKQMVLVGDTIVGLVKALAIENPTASEDMTMFRTKVALTLTEIAVVLMGTTPSLTWTIRFDSDRSATGTEVVTGGTTSTNTTTGDIVTSFTTGAIPAGSYVWLETTAASGTIDEVNITLTF